MLVIHEPTAFQSKPVTWSTLLREIRAATIVGDLSNSDVLPVATFDCFILAQTLHIIYEMRRVIENAAKALRPDGVLLATLPCVSRIDYESGLQGDCWRVTPRPPKSCSRKSLASVTLKLRVLAMCWCVTGFSWGFHQVN